jgi:hypothetical protein
MSKPGELMTYSLKPRVNLSLIETTFRISENNNNPIKNAADVAPTAVAPQTKTERDGTPNNNLKGTCA